MFSFAEQMSGVMNMGIKLYNKIPVTIREIKKMIHFKSTYITFVMTYIPLCRVTYVKLNWYVCEGE
jgi:hypothetical protein